MPPPRELIRLASEAEERARLPLRGPAVRLVGHALSVSRPATIARATGDRSDPSTAKPSST